MVDIQINSQLPNDGHQETLEVCSCHININYCTPQNEHDRGSCKDVMDFVKSVLLSVNSVK